MIINVFQKKPEQNHDGTANLVRLLENLPSSQVIQTMNYAWIDPGKQLEEHKHDDCIEYYLFLEGNGLMLINNKEIVVSKGDFLPIEVGQIHSLINTGNEKLVFVTLRALLQSM